jgi:hypothetical protein
MNGEKKYLIHNIDQSPHTGQMLKAYFKKRRIHKSALARKLHRHISSLVSFQKNATIQTTILWEICHVLKHNFFNDMAVQLPADYTTDAPMQTHLNLRITALEAELKIAISERDILLKAIGK